MELVPSFCLERPFNTTEHEHWNIRGLVNQNHYIQLTPDFPATSGFISSKEVNISIITRN
jgi:hypothetical protein